VNISVCIPTVRPQSLAAALTSVRRQRRQSWEVVVLAQGDEASTRATVATAAGGDRRIRYVQLPERGLSRARNAAFEVARGDVVAFLDDDCEADPGWLDAIAEGFERDRGLGLVGGALVAPPRPRWALTSCPWVAPAEALYDPAAHPRRPPRGWDWFGANVALRADIVTRIGRWDECLGAGATFPAAEDTDYKLRLEAAGVRMLTTPRSVVFHSSGMRRGLSALRTSQRNYAVGNGAMAAKLTLLGDARGALWLRDTRRDLCASLRRGRPQRAPVDLRRLWYFERTYRHCVAHYEVDSEGLLRLRHATPPPTVPAGPTPGRS
jgi:GT2 family glycosyltransferase